MHLLYPVNALPYIIYTLVTTRSKNDPDEKVVEKLRDAILTGEFSFNPSLTERQVSENLKLSRTPVFAVLQALAQALANGELLVYETQRGYRMWDVNLETIFGAHTVRASPEALACQEKAETGLLTDTARTLKACIVEGRTFS